MSQLAASVRVARRDLVVEAELTVPEGQVVGLVGPSGAGKSTVLAAVAGLAPLEAGRVVFGDQVLAQVVGGRPVVAVPLRDRRIGMVAQRPALFPHLTVAENLAYGAPGGPRDPEVGRLAEELGLTGLLGARPARLSGGQRQRVALGRALASQPRVLLLDEPFVGLDPAWRDRVAALVRAEVTRRGLPTVLVTHDLEDIRQLAGTLGVMESGRIHQQGPLPALLRCPRSRRVAELLGYRWFVPTAALRGPAGGGLPEEAEVVGLHPAHLVAAASGAGAEDGWQLGGRVASVSDLGVGFEVRLVVGGVGLDLTLPAGSRPPEVGAGWTVPLPSAPCFDGTGCLVGSLGERSPARAGC